MSIDPVIYTIINIINDKQYVGQAARKHHRWKNHKIALRTNAHNNKHLQSSYNKYGKDAFIFVVLENLFDCSNLDEREQYWIDTLKPEYNKAPVVGSCLGVKHSDETKARWSEQRKGQKRTGEALINIQNGLKNRGPVSDETRAKMSKSNKTKHSDEHKKKLLEDMKGNQRAAGMVHSKERIATRVAKIKGQKRSPEQLARMSAAHRAKPLSLAARNRRKRRLTELNKSD
jgi:group I intron endonuclease